nr:immunoglobulin light chain junction region [Macaca mulatta]
DYFCMIWHNNAYVFF